MAHPQSEKLARKRKAEAKRCKSIMEDLELHDACNEKRRRQYAAAKQKKKDKKPSKKVIEAQRLKWRIQKQSQNNEACRKLYAAAKQKKEERNH